MKKRILYVIIIILIIVACILFVNKGSSANETIKVGVKSDFDRFSSYDETNERYSGFEIDLSKILFNELGYSNIEYVTVDTNNREEMLLNGDVDCIMGGYSYSEDRSKKFDLSTPYYSDAFMIVSLNSSMFCKLEDLSDCNIGIINSDFVDKTVKAILNNNGAKNYRIIRVDSYDKLSKMIDSANLDAVALDQSMGMNYLYDGFYTILYKEPNASEFCIALPKDSSLTGKIKSQLKEFNDAGTINKMLKRWGIEQ